MRPSRMNQRVLATASWKAAARRLASDGSEKEEGTGAVVEADPDIPIFPTLSRRLAGTVTVVSVARRRVHGRGRRDDGISPV
jgi:hypothetical protein